MNSKVLLSHRNQEPENGVLYLVGTPIGNLNDLSSRAKNILENVFLIACEDTRQTKKIMNKFGIKNTFFRIFKALDEISFKFPIGVPTKYKTPFSGS